MYFLIFQGNQILSNVSSEEYSRIVKVLEDAILSTDVAVYCRYDYLKFHFIPLFHYEGLVLIAVVIGQ